MKFLLTIVKSILGPVFCKIILISITSTVIGISILLLKKLIGKKISLRVNYFLWIIFFISLLLAPRIQSDLSIYNYINIEKLNEISTNFKFDSLDTYEDLNIEENSEIKDFRYIVENHKNKLEIRDILSMIYFSIILIKIVLSSKKYIKLLFFNNEELENDSEEILLIKKIKNKLKIDRKIKIFKTSYISSPMIGGFFRPKIWISNSNKSDDLYYMLTHELCHLKRKDHIVNVFLNIFKIIYFFNPFIIKCLDRIEKDIELATDELVLKTLNIPKSKKYCNLIICETAKKNNISINLGFARKIDFTEERINTILEDESISFKKRYYIIIILFYIFVLIFCFTKEKTYNSYEDKNYVYIIVEDNLYKLTPAEKDNINYPIIKCSPKGIIRVKGKENLLSLEVNIVETNNVIENNSSFFFNNDDILIYYELYFERILYKMKIKYKTNEERNYYFMMESK